MNRRTVLKTLGVVTAAELALAKERALANEEATINGGPLRAEGSESDAYFVHTYALWLQSPPAFTLLHASEGPFDALSAAQRQAEVARRGLLIGTIYIPVHLVQLVEVRPS